MIDVIASLPIEEQATTINFYRDGEAADIWTSDRTMFTKLDRLCREYPDNYKCVEISRDGITKEVLSKSYRIEDKALLSFRTARQGNKMTEEQKAAAAERLKRLRMLKLAQ